MARATRRTFLEIAPTGSSVDSPVVIVAELRDDLLARERLYRDRANVLDQFVVRLDG